MGCSASTDGDCSKDYREWTTVAVSGGRGSDGQSQETEEGDIYLADQEPVFEEITLTARQNLAIRKSWLRLQPTLTAVGKQVFLRIFEFRPSVKRMFPFRDAWGDRLIKHPQFIEQARRFMQVIHCVVASLDCPKSRCAERLVKLGRKHVTIEGFLPDYFDVFTRAITSVWKQELKDDFAEETAVAWALLFAFIIENLKIGYDAEFKIRFQNLN